jgi:hypothetical protein
MKNIKSIEVLQAQMEALGWMYAEACNMLDRGEDLRKVEVPEILARFHKAFEEAQDGKNRSNDV